MISKNRYLSNQKWEQLLKALPYHLPTSVIGHSVLNQPIYAHRLGKGPKKVLLWSQMHGNESTTTRALLDLFDHLHSISGAPLLEGLTLLIIPQLNPDGAKLYTRNNYSDIDLNRDALNLSQPESLCLVNLYKKINPEFCFNLHGQKTTYSVGVSNKSAVVSYLAPSISDDNQINEAR